MTRSNTSAVDAEIQRRAPGVTVRLKRVDDQTVAVQLISVPTSQRGYGLGQRALDIVCSWADQEMMTLALSPSGHLGSDQKRLVAWYGRAGFTPSRLVAGQTMRRLPTDRREQLTAA